MSDISDIITRLRTEKGLTQQELADLLFVSRSLVSMWELGLRIPDYLSVERMSELFNVQMGDIIPDVQYVYILPEEMKVLENEIDEISRNDESLENDPDILMFLINKFVSMQSNKNREIFMSRYLLMKTCRSIGDDLGINEASVKSRLARMRKRLRQYLDIKK